MKVFGIDYDDTYSDDPDLFAQIVSLIKSRGHVAVIVTYRHGIKDKIPETGCEVFYTGGTPKAQFMRDAGLEVDIWIDDYPELIGETH